MEVLNIDLQELPMRGHVGEKGNPSLASSSDMWTLCGLTEHVNISDLENILATQGPKCSIFPAVLSFEWKPTGVHLQKFQDCNDSYPPNTVIVRCELSSLISFCGCVAVMSKVLDLRWNVHKE